MSVSDYRNRHSYRKKDKSSVTHHKKHNDYIIEPNYNGLKITTENKLTGARKSILTNDEIVFKYDPNNLNIWLKLNDQLMQNSSTKKMIHSVFYIISYISQFMSLQPGDIISTGTPSGVGMGMNPQRFLKPGDKMRLGIDGLGEQNQKVV